jgi:hypothetical protein
METLTTFGVAGLLRAGAAEIRAEVEALPEEVLAWHPMPGEWCVKECLGHIIEAERRGFAGRIRVLLEHDGDATLVSWDQTAVARERNDCDADSAQLLLEFLGLREASVSLVASLKPEDMGRGGEHPDVGHLTIGEIVNEWVHHDRNHFKQMLSNVQDYVWDSMGSAQKFSQPR